MKQYKVTGMSCAVCAGKVEKAVRAVPGVTGCSVNLLTGQLRVDGDATDGALHNAVSKAGYGIASSKSNTEKSKETPASDDTRGMVYRLVSSIILTLAVMYMSMGVNMLRLPLPRFFSDYPTRTALVQMLISLTVMIINCRFFKNGWRGIVTLAPGMDTLVALGSGAAWVYSTGVLLVMSGRDISAQHEYLHGLYFESAAMILTLITVGKLLESYSKGRTTSALRSLMELAPETATLVTSEGETAVPIGELEVGDTFVVRPGEKIPCDGVVTDGISSVDQAAVTGESIPIDKTPGDKVICATLNVSGKLYCRAEKVGEDTTLARIVKLVSTAQTDKAPIARLADKAAAFFVPAVTLIAALTFIAWMIIGKGMGFSLARAISVLVISCPCALGLATPVAIMVGSGKGAKQGILFKTSTSLEELGKVDIVALDKTGTITTGEPTVTDILPAESVTEDGLLGYAAALEQDSEHPLAGAIMRAADERGIAAGAVSALKILPGMGLEAELDGQPLRGGNASYISRYAAYSEDTDSRAAAGKTLLFFAIGDRYLGCIAVADSPKAEAREAVEQLHQMGVETVMLTGDDPRTAASVAAGVGIDKVMAGLMPEDKSAVVSSLTQGGSVAMVGDGINDAPALAHANIGVAIGAGTDIAIDAAEVVLMRPSAADIPAALRLSRATLRVIKQNLFWAFFYNLLAIPLAMGVFIPLTGWEMSPMIGAAAMSLSSLFVVTNALRLNLVDIHDPRHDKKKNRKKKKEIKKMTVTMHITGMMCPHCEARVKKTLEALSEVESAQVSHTAGTAVLTLLCPASSEKLKEAVEADGYTVTAID